MWVLTVMIEDNVPTKDKELLLGVLFLLKKKDSPLQHLSVELVRQPQPL